MPNHASSPLTSSAPAFAFLSVTSSQLRVSQEENARLQALLGQASQDLQASAAAAAAFASAAEGGDIDPSVVAAAKAQAQAAALALQAHASSHTAQLEEAMRVRDEELSEVRCSNEELLQRLRVVSSAAACDPLAPSYIGSTSSPV